VDRGGVEGGVEDVPAAALDRLLGRGVAPPCPVGRDEIDVEAEALQQVVGDEPRGWMVAKSVGDNGTMRRPS
jgi:hypothetical protein